MDVVAGLAALFGNAGNTVNRELYIEAPYYVVFNPNDLTIIETYRDGKKLKYQLVVNDFQTDSETVTGIRNMETDDVIPVTVIKDKGDNDAS